MSLMENGRVHEKHELLATRFILLYRGKRKEGGKQLSLDHK